NWYEPGHNQWVYCATHERYRRVPGGDPARGAAEGQGGTPDRLTAPTLAESLKAATDGKARVVSLSFKDRAAVLPGGKRPAPSSWPAGATGTSVPQSHARGSAPRGVDEFTRRKVADRWLGQKWERLRSDLDYAARSGPDDAPGEGKGAGKGEAFQGVTFP